MQRLEGHTLETPHAGADGVVCREWYPPLQSTRGFEERRNCSQAGYGGYPPTIFTIFQGYFMHHRACKNAIRTHNDR